MKVSNRPIPSSHKYNQPTKKSIHPKQILATGTGISVRSKTTPRNIVKENNPEDPLVAKKILDSLNLGFINFNQKERDGLAKILSNKSRATIGQQPTDKL